MNALRTRLFALLGVPLLPLALAAATLVGATAPARADIVIDFETNPSLPAQSDNFADAGAMQSYSQAGVWSITGGVVLGNPTFLPAFTAHGSAPNLYGTTDTAGPSLQSTIELDMPASAGITSVSGLLFNGQNFAESYTVTFNSGGTLLNTQTLNLADNTDPDGSVGTYSQTGTAALPITQVLITTPNAGSNGWDFFTDTIRLSSTAPVPEPSTFLMLSVGGLSVVLVARLRRRMGSISIEG
jgi:hypothetical protein